MRSYLQRYFYVVLQKCLVFIYLAIFAMTAKNVLTLMGDSAVICVYPKGY